MEGSNTHPIGAERQVLGNLLMFGATSFDLVEEILDSSSWAINHHRELWDWISQQVKKQGPVNPTVVIESVGNSYHLQERFGGGDYLASLPDHACMTAQIGALATLVADAAKLRTLAKECEATLHHIREGKMEVDALVADAERRVLGVNITANRSSSVQSMKDVAALAKRRVKRIEGGDVSVEYVPTFFPSYDRHYTGFPRGWPVYLGGRPKMGKTALALALMLRGADKAFGGVSIPWGIVSLEMPATKLMYRLAGTKSGVGWSTVKSGQATPEQMQRYYDALDYLAGLPISIDSDVRSVEAVVSAIRRMARVNGCSGVVVDYFQLVKGSGRNAGETVGLDAVADELRDVAKTEDIALVVLSQLNQMSENTYTGGRKGVPTGGNNFRGTEKMFQDAGYIGGVYREFHYHPPRGMNGQPYSEQKLASCWQPLELITLGAREDSRFSPEFYIQMGTGRIADSLDEGFTAPTWPRKGLTPTAGGR